MTIDAPALHGARRGRAEVVGAFPKNSHAKIEIAIRYGADGAASTIILREIAWNGRGFAPTPKGIGIPAARLDALVAILRDVRAISRDAP